MATYASSFIGNNVNFGWYGTYGTGTSGSSGSDFTITYNDGTQSGSLVVTGTGFTYSGGKLTGGTVTFISDLQNIIGGTSVLYYDNGVSIPAVAFQAQVDSKSSTADLNFTNLLFSGRDTVQGGPADQTLYGAALNDLVLPASGNDVVWGGTGVNIAQYDAPRSAVTSVQIVSETQVLISGDPTSIGNDTLNNISQINLSDGQLVYNIPFAPVDQSIYRLYSAAFARTPDQEGFTYWYNQNANNGVSLNAIANDFVNSAEFIATYGYTTNKQYVDLLYINTLGRPADPAGEAFWVGLLDTGKATRSQELIAFADSQENISNQAPNIVNGYWLL